MISPYSNIIDSYEKTKRRLIKEFTEFRIKTVENSLCFIFNVIEKFYILPQN